MLSPICCALCARGEWHCSSRPSAALPTGPRPPEVWESAGFVGQRGRRGRVGSTKAARTSPESWAGVDEKSVATEV